MNHPPVTAACATRRDFLTYLAAAGLLASCGGSDDPPPSERLTLTQKIGQMVMIGVIGASVDAPAVQQALAQIATGQLGGVILYGRNVTGPTQVQALNDALAAAAPIELPLLIALDQEGGRVQRLRASNGFADTPAAEAVAAQQTLQQARDTYRVMARMVAQAGFNFNFGPVVDLRGDPGDPEHRPVSPVIGKLQRAFSDDPATVVAYATQFVEAHREAGVATALKHYPGHGLATGDTHLGLVDVTLSAQPIEQWPFQEMVRRGMADAVMSAHLLNRRVDPHWPVTLSEHYVEPQLRRRDGFAGVMVTDDLHMGAIQKYHSLRDTVVRSILAGNDLLILSNNPLAAPEIPGFQPRFDLGQVVAGIVLDAIDRGELSEARIEASWQRLARLRAGLLALART
ncbi:MAG: twin-arginine translocation signal domain-containing protein [Burkholderiales bacterium]|nr:twin-arginine translocation signal domain-containing protein [Burkholderiales bacterium]MBK8665686.1 twin-arginine translocation signal domain-containing protein [Burkholderiales bacterium]